MYEEIIKAQKDNSLTINYNKWIFDTISPYIGNKVLDVGVGCGNFLKYLLNKDLVVAIDILDIFVDTLCKTYSGSNNIHVFKCDIQGDDFMQIANNYSVDTVICNNALEHVEDDLKALNNIHKILCDAGRLVLILPAFKFLYSKWDKSVGHFRRYEFQEIKEKLAAANFSIKLNFYMNILGFFAWFINGRILGYTPNTGHFIEGQAVFFDRYMVNSLRKIEKLLHPPFGQSLIIVASPIRN